MFPPLLKGILFGCMIVAVLYINSASAGVCDGITNYALWNHWGPCSVTCGEGKRSRECRCVNKKDPDVPVGGNGGCTSALADLAVVEKGTCKLKDCPDDDLDPIIIILIIILILPMFKIFG